MAGAAKTPCTKDCETTCSLAETNTTLVMFDMTQIYKIDKTEFHLLLTNNEMVIIIYY